MIPIKRGTRPRILANRADLWTKAFLAEKKKNGAAKPASKRYGHKEVRAALQGMSHGKCFYCEDAVSGASEQVDHHVEHTERPDLAYDWDCLYLSCIDCNVGKPPNTEIPVVDCVDPCGCFAKAKFEDHLAFRDEVLCERNRSARGLKTIQKYRLNRSTLLLKRGKKLQEFYKLVIKIQAELIRENRALTELDIERLQVFASPTMPFSRMIDACLQGFLHKLNAGGRPPSRSRRGGRGGAPAAR